MGKFLKFVSFRKRYILLSFVILVILLFIIYHVNTRIFYDVEPIEKVVTNDLVGTWRFIPPISKKLFAKPSIIILKRDGSYEIHNPPIWVRKKCKPPTKIFMSESCGEIITGNWTLGKRKPSAGFNGIDQFGLHIQGKRQPYQLQYCRVAPDITPLRCWQWISKETQCPLCQKENNSIREIKEPIYEFIDADSYQQKLELEESKYERYFAIVIGIFLMVIGILYKVFKKSTKLPELSNEDESQKISR